MTLILLVLLPTTVLLGFFGIQDIRTALTYPGRITGAALIVFAVVTLLGAIAVLDHWSRGSFAYSGLVALLGTLAAFVANGMLLVETLRDGDSTAYLTLWSLLTAGSVCAAVAVCRTTVVIPAPKRLAAAVIITTALAVANFSYEYLFQPSRRGAKPLVKMSVGEPVLRQDRKAFAVPVDIELENGADVGFYVLGTEFHAMGEEVPLSQKDRLHEQWRADAENWSKAQEKHPLSRREIHQTGQLVAAQPWMPIGTWIEAGEKLATQTVVQLPMDTPYDQLAFYATASFARKDRLGLERLEQQGYSWREGHVPEWVKKGGLDSVIYRGRLYENNALDAHTRDPRWITVYWRFGTHGADLAENIARQGEEDRILPGAESRDLVERYGLVKAVTGPYEQTLWAIKSRR
ncbi:hypothetical protein [Streptomyces tricolor]|nr:hypothetical protein [Streptomyces tricolor]